MSPVTIVTGAGFGARSCNLAWLPVSRSVFLLFMNISSFLVFILNFKLFNTFSVCGSGTDLEDAVTDVPRGVPQILSFCGTAKVFFVLQFKLPVTVSSCRLAGLHVPSRFARIITEARGGSGLAGGVPPTRSCNTYKHIH